MNVNNISLKNGLKVCIISDNNTNNITFHLKGLAGSNFESNSQIGSAHILEHFYTSSNYGNKIVSNGGNIIGVTSRDDVLFMVKTNKINTIDTLEFLSRIFKNDPITDSELKKLKGISIQEIHRILSNPEKILGRYSLSTSFFTGRISKINIGEEKNIINLKKESLLDFRSKYYHPNNFTLVISGNVSITTILPYIKKYFGEYKKGPDVKIPNFIKIPDLNIKLYKFENIPQILEKIDFYGYKGKDDNRYLLLIISNILSLSLNKLIKDMLGLVYSIKCVPFSSSSYGLFSIYFSCDRKNLGIINREIKKIIDSYSSLLSTRSIQNAKNKVLSNLSLEMDKISVRAEYYSDLILHGKTQYSYDYEVNSIKNCKLIDIRNNSQRIFNQKPKITIVGNNINEEEIRDIWI